MPADMSKYPKDWPIIRERILERSGGQCEMCGAWNYMPHPVTGSDVVLTIAHIHNPDPMDCRDENLMALCQKCHNTLDAPMRAVHRRETQQRKAAEAREQAGQRSLWD